MSRLAVVGLGLGFVLAGCPTRAGWMADESDRIERDMKRPALPAAGEKDPALAGIALGAEAPALAPARPTPTYTLAQPSQRRSRSKSAPPRRSTSRRLDPLGP